MNKLFTRIGVAFVGIAMAVGVGVAVGSKAEAKEAKATAGSTIVYTITQSTVTDYPSSYSSTETTWSQNNDGGTISMSFALANHMKNNSNMQSQASAGYFRNTTVPDGYAIKSIAVGNGGTARTWTMYGDDAELTSSNYSTSGTSLGSYTSGAAAKAFGSGETYDTTHYPHKYFYALRGSNAQYATNYVITLVELEPAASEYTLTYNGNGNTGGSVPANATAYAAGSTVTVLGNTNSLVKVVNDVSFNFTGWNTAADGSGTSYKAGDTFALNKDVTLYAQWWNPNATKVLPINLSDMSSTAGEVSATYKTITFAVSNGLRDGDNDHIRVYKNATLTVSCPRKILSIEFTCKAEGTTKYGPGCFAELDGYSYSGAVGTWEGESKSVVFTASGDQVRITQLIVTLEPLTPIDSLSMDATHTMYEGQSWTPTITYNDSATVKTSEIVVVSGGEYVTVSNGTISAKVGVMETNSVTVVVKAHATDVENSEVYSSNCTITINKNVVTKVEVTTDPTKVSYVEGQKLNLTGMVLTLTWSIGDPTTISSGYEGVTTTPSLNTTLTVASHNGIEVLVTYNGQTTAANDGFVITVVAKAVSSITNWTGATTSYQIGATLVADGTLSVTYNDESNGELDVAELWANSEATFKLGDADVTPGTTTLAAGDNGKRLTISYSGKTRYIVLSVRDFEWTFMVQVKKLNDLNFSNGRYVIAAHDGDDVYLMTSAVPETGQISGFDNDDAWNDTFGGSIRTMRADLSAYAWTLSGSASAAVLTDLSDNSLGYPGSGTNFSRENTAWTISESGKSYGTFKIVNNTTTNRVAAFSKNTDKFGAFAASNLDSAGDYVFVEIYEIFDVSKTTLGSWADAVDYVNEINCNIAGSYTFNADKTWNSMASQFADLEDEVRAYFKHASYSYNESTGVTTATYATNADVAAFVCKYDYIIDKYGWTDFIQRNGTAYDLFNGVIIDNPLNNASFNSPALMIVIVLSSITLVAIGACFVFKRKER